MPRMTITIELPDEHTSALLDCKPGDALPPNIGQGATFARRVPEFLIDAAIIVQHLHPQIMEPILQTLLYHKGNRDQALAHHKRLLTPTTPTRH